MNEKSTKKRLKRVKAQLALQRQDRVKKRQAKNLEFKARRKFERLMNRMNGVTIRNENLRNKPDVEFLDTEQEDLGTSVQEK